MPTPSLPRPAAAPLDLPVPRRGLLGGALAGLATGLVPGLAGAQPAPAAPRVATPTDAERQEWLAYRDRFLQPEGRVVDTGNRNVSHTEGQGWSMLLAARVDDRASFERMWNWTRRTLKRRTDQLHSWRYQPGAAVPVADPNNATDGDLFLAWALLEAQQRWGVADHGAQAVAITRDVLKLLVRRRGGATVLLPGVRGFETRQGVVLNPSYYVFPAFPWLARAVPDPAWVALAADGLALLRAARFGKWRLPPDWVAMDRGGTLSLALPEGMAPRFGFDAVRVPLYLAWAGIEGEPAVQAAMSFWRDPTLPAVPAWVDLTNDGVASYAAAPGVASIARFAAARRAGVVLRDAELPRVAAAPDYYSAALGMLVRQAWRDTGATEG